VYKKKKMPIIMTRLASALTKTTIYAHSMVRSTSNFIMTYYVSITGLQVKSLLHMPSFFWHTSASKSQADAAAGNIQSMLTYRNGIYHTLTVWKDRKSMTRFMAAGAHAKAMKMEQSISVPGGTKVYGYETETIPTWDEALQRWEEHGTRHGTKPTKSQISEPHSSPHLGRSLEKVRLRLMGNAEARTISSLVAILLVALLLKN
jgi:Domain of unknown function (DUF3291)